MYSNGFLPLDFTQAASLSIYVCFAEDPDALYYNDRALFDQLAQVQELHVLDDLENAIYGDSEDDTSDDSDEFLELSSDSEDDDDIDPDMMITEKELEEVSTDESEGEQEDDATDGENIKSARP